MSEKSHFMKALDDLKDSKEISTVVSKANKHAKKEKIKVLVDREMTKIKRMKQRTGLTQINDYNSEKELKFQSVALKAVLQFKEQQEEYQKSLLPKFTQRTEKDEVSYKRTTWKTLNKGIDELSD